MKITIQKKEQEFSFVANQNESVLYAGLRQDLTLPYECASGTCGSCRARLVTGDLDLGWPQAPGRDKLKLDKGEFLMCQASAQSDCAIRIPGKIAQSTGNIVPDHYIGILHSLQPLTHDVLQFELQLAEPITFHAGQFVVLESPAVEGFRAYSMVNYDKNTQQLKFVIKRLPNGKFSDWVFDALTEDATVAVFGPLGNATFHTEEEQNILCIAGGSGIAGMMSILTHGCRDNYFANRQGQLFFGVRAAADLFFLPELSEFAHQFPHNLKLTIAFSEESVSRDDILPDNIIFTAGLVHEAAQLTDLGSDNSIAYIAGPPPMVDAALRSLMLEAGFAATQIRYDKFA